MLSWRRGVRKETGKRLAPATAQLLPPWQMGVEPCACQSGSTAARGQENPCRRLYDRYNYLSLFFISSVMGWNRLNLVILDTHRISLMGSVCDLVGPDI